MKKIVLAFALVSLSVLIFSFVTSKQTMSNYQKSWWYVCDQCGKSTIGNSNNSPWESGCKAKGGSQHHYQPAGEAGSKSWGCTKCDANVSLVQGQSPTALTCPKGNTHSWRSN
jgi:hypothetical protein